MKIAIACQNKKTISAHAGKTSRFYIYTVDEGAKEIINKELVTLAKEDILHTRFHESENPWADHPIFAVDILLTGGAGMGFVNKLASQSTQVIITPETDPDRAVELLLAGSLPQQAAAHHHHHH